MTEDRFTKFAEELGQAGAHLPAAIVCFMAQLYALNDRTRLRILADIAHRLSADSCFEHSRGEQESEAIAEMVREL